MADQLVNLHRAASAWYEEHGRIVPAIDHALASGNHVHALALLEQYGEQLLEEGRMRLLSRWFSAIPEQMLRDKPMVQVVRIWAVCYTRGPLEARSMLEASGCADSSNADVRPHMLALRTSLLVMADRMDEAAQIGAAAMRELPFSRPFAESALINCMALIHSAHGAASPKPMPCSTPHAASRAQAMTCSIGCIPIRWKALSIWMKAACARPSRVSGWRSAPRTRRPTTMPTAMLSPVCYMPTRCTRSTNCARPPTCCMSMCRW